RQLRELLLDATLIRLRSDVPVGAYLSGGLDSSVLVSLIAGMVGIRLHTFSITFPDSKLDERLYQDEMSKQLAVEHSRITCVPDDVAAGFVNAIWHIESPILRTAPV